MSLERLTVLSIVLLGAAIRTYIWFHGYVEDGEPAGLVRHGDGYLRIASSFRPNSDIGFFDQWRASYQLVYPLYLAPIFAFDLSDSIYIFWLHHAFAASTIVLIYLSAKRLFDPLTATIAAFTYAAHLQMAYWFNWALADTALHFHLALFLYWAVLSWEAFTVARALGLLACALLISFCRPEGFVVSGLFAGALCFRWLSSRVGPAKAFAGVTVLAMCVAAAGLLAVSRSERVKETVLSNMAVGWGLYYGSQRTPTRAELVDAMLVEMYRYGGEKASSDPEKHNSWYWNSVAGLQRIQAHPFRYVGYAAERLVNAVVPSFFRQGVSFRYKVIDRSLALFLIVGLAVALTARHASAALLRSLVLSAFGVYLLVSFYQSEWDVRVQLSAHVFLIPIASSGWTVAWRRVQRRWRARADLGRFRDARIAGEG